MQTVDKFPCFVLLYIPSKRYVKIAEDGRLRPTEGVNLSGDRKVGNCNRIALRRIPYTVGCRRGKADVSANLSGKRTESSF